MRRGQPLHSRTCPSPDSPPRNARSAVLDPVDGLGTDRWRASDGPQGSTQTLARLLGAVRLSSGNQHISVELVAKLPNFTPKPAHAGGRLLVTLFSGAPFAPGTSSVTQVFLNVSQAPLLTGLKTAIGVLAIDAEDEDEADDRRNERDDDDSTQYLVLENASVGPFFNGPRGRDSPAVVGTVPTTQ